MVELEAVTRWRGGGGGGREGEENETRLDHVRHPVNNIDDWTTRNLS